MSKSNTERASYRFTVTQYDDGTPWIMCEPVRKGLNVVDDGFLGFDLADGTTFEEAQEIARVLNEKIDGVTHTNFS